MTKIEVSVIERGRKTSLLEEWQTSEKSIWGVFGATVSSVTGRFTVRGPVKSQNI